ncbi:MAG: integrase [Betaproteobacteria bacterium HGW-Betaproteobacteria-18]|nr:MAG: integrase [Betaproteobacteria bacterium HGW-Betaproteobacteria-18]
MAIRKLTDLKIKAKIREIEDLQFSPQAKNALVGDGEGLYLGISKSGTASWLFRYMDHGKAKSVGLGGYPSTSLQIAREKAQTLRDARTGGIDPVQAKKAVIREQKLQLAKAKTFETCALEFIEFSRPSWKNVKHGQQWTNTLTQYAFPVIGKNGISDIHADDIVRILSPIWQTKKETASRLRGRIESILDWATVNGWRKGDNPARFKGHMEYLLPKVRAGAQTHHPSLPYEKMPAFMKELHSQSGMAQYALEFLILCASRTGEIVGAKWEEFDLAKGVWTIPAARMKADLEHRVPLGARALQILTIIRPFSGKNFVFVTGKKDVGMSTMAMAMLLRRMNVTDITVHGMRSTFRNWAGEKTTYPFQVCEQALAHRLPDAVAAAYLRSDFFVNRVNLMKDWATFALSECKY